MQSDSSLDTKIVCVRVDDISKNYLTWKDPKSRLKHPFLQFVRSLFKLGGSRYLDRIAKIIDQKSKAYVKHHRASNKCYVSNYKRRVRGYSWSKWFR